MSWVSGFHISPMSKSSIRVSIAQLILAFLYVCQFIPISLQSGFQDQAMQNLAPANQPLRVYWVE